MNDLSALRAYIADKKKDIAAVVSASLEELSDRIITRTPVDTGLAVTNMQPTLDAPAPHSLTLRDPSGEHARAAVAAVAPKAAGHVYWLVNNTDYANDLEFGKSDQAPRGMFRVSLKEFLIIWNQAIADRR